LRWSTAFSAGKKLPSAFARVIWSAAGFPQPVTYEGSRAVMRPFREVIAAALQITRANADGSFFPAENAVLHRNLLAAYGPATVAAADSG